MALAALRIADAPTADGQVWSDGWVVDPRDDVIYVLSLIGSPTAVRTLHAAIAERADLRLTHQRTTRDLKPHALSRYQTRWGRLPSGAVHAVISFPPAGARLVMAESETTLPWACFEDLVLHRGLMAIPEWAPRIFEMLLERNQAQRLAGPIPAVLVGASETALDQLVQEGLQQGAIAFPSETQALMAASG
jgi:hypothetical protein